MMLELTTAAGAPESICEGSRGRVRLVSLDPLDAERQALAHWVKHRDSCLLLPGRESARWLADRYATSILSSRRMLLTDEDWSSRIGAMPPERSVTYVGPPLTREQRRDLVVVAAGRNVHLFVQTSDAYRQWRASRALPRGLNEADNSEVPRPGAAFAASAIAACARHVVGGEWNMVRICVADDAGQDFAAELTKAARAENVPVSLDERIGGAGSPA